MAEHDLLKVICVFHTYVFISVGGDRDVSPTVSHPAFERKKICVIPAL